MTEKKVLWKNIDINLFFFHLSEFFNWFKCLSFKVHELHPSFFSFTSLFFLQQNNSFMIIYEHFNLQNTN